MDEKITKIPLCKLLDPDQETIIDIIGEIYEPVVILGHITELKEKIGSQIFTCSWASMNLC